jgi:TRAP-type C4-dicarboxylate transport system permease large subunit
MAVAYGLFVGFVVYRTLTLRDLYEMLVEAGELSAVILIVIALASVFAWSTSTLGIVQPIAPGSSTWARRVRHHRAADAGADRDRDVPRRRFDLPDPAAGADPHRQRLRVGPHLVRRVLTMKIAIGQFTPPLAVNLMVSCRIAGVTMESTVPWVVWMILAMFVALALVVVFPGIALWLPRAMGLG